MSFHVHLRRHRRREVHNRDHKATRQTPEQSPYMRCDIHQRVPYIYLIQDPSRSHSVSYSDYMVRSTSGSKHPSEVEGCLVPHVAKVCSNSFRIPISSCAMCYVLCAMYYVLCAIQLYVPPESRKSQVDSSYQSLLPRKESKRPINSQ
jgi:hypothetical protein